MEVTTMFRRLGLGLPAFLLVLWGLLPGCAGMMGSERRETNAEVVLVSFGSTNGELAPCG